MNRPATGFLDQRRLLKGPWQAFERDVGRLLLVNGFEDVRIVGGSGDHGADILGARGGKLWVVQCKFTSSSRAARTAVSEIVEAGRYYQADHLVVALSRPAGQGLLNEVRRYERSGLRIKVAGPRRLLQLMRTAGAYSPTRKRLRDYQLDATARFREGLIDTGRAQIVMATGLGKTVVMAETVADLLRDGLVEGGRILVLAHTNTLVDQLHRSFWHQLPSSTATHQYSAGEIPAYWDGITFATIQSVSSRLQSGSLPRFGLVLVDEAHHIGAETFRTVLDTLEPPMLGGVTATPWRGDGYDIDELLGRALVTIGIDEGLRRGFLTEVDYRLLGDDLDWEFVRRASEYHYSLKQLNRRLIIPKRDEEAARIVAQVFKEEDRRGAIVYTPSILHARNFAALLSQFGLRASSISSEKTPRERDRFMSAFRAGRLDIATTVDLFNEGVDVPDVDLIVFMRATHSRRIFVQQLGRGLRMSQGKDKVIVLDFVTDLRRVAEVVHLDQSVRGAEVERLGLGPHLIQFSEHGAGDFLKEWMLDQADLMTREADPKLELPRFNFPRPASPGAVE